MRIRRLLVSALMALAMVPAVAGTALASEASVMEDIEIGPCGPGAEVRVRIPTPFGYLIVCVNV